VLTDVMERGPFAYWEHAHHFEGTPTGTRLSDDIRYTLPFGPLGALAAGEVKRNIDRVFTYRHRRLAHDLARHALMPTPQVIVISGATGFVGQGLEHFLTTGGHTVKRLTRTPRPGTTDIGWNPDTGTLNPADLDGVDAVVHLAGENISSKRWTAAHIEYMKNNRGNAAALLGKTLAALPRKPKTFIVASAVGFYGDTGTQTVTEYSTTGNTLSADITRRIEAGLEPAAAAGIRTVAARLGVVLGRRGGAVARMWLPFKMGMGGVIGSGEQFWSWIGLDDAVYALHVLLANDVRGPVNLTSPNPVTNRDFTRAFARTLRRPAFAPMPAFAARAAFGPMADELLLGSCRALPDRLISAGYSFQTADLATALAWELNGLWPNDAPYARMPA
jgi:uncharacterized protein (TIGR01777 family)